MKTHFCYRLGGIWYIDLDWVSRLLHDALEHDHDLVSPLEEVLGAHVVEGAVWVDLVNEGGWPDEEQLILLSLTVSPDLDKCHILSEHHGETSTLTLSSVWE